MPARISILRDILMSFECPQCSVIKSLRITSSIELAADARSDEISLQIVYCSSCKFEALAVYEESRRGSLSSDAVDHYCYPAARNTIQATRGLIRHCPNPKNARCQCASHEKLNQRDPTGRWITPGFETGMERYPMKL
jgi:hypothetical protein